LGIQLCSPKDFYPMDYQRASNLTGNDYPRGLPLSGPQVNYL
jgi:hypothetical protein